MFSQGMIGTAPRLNRDLQQHQALLPGVDIGGSQHNPKSGIPSKNLVNDVAGFRVVRCSKLGMLFLILTQRGPVKVSAKSSGCQAHPTTPRAPQCSDLLECFGHTAVRTPSRPGSDDFLGPRRLHTASLPVETAACHPFAPGSGSVD